ncbi:MAG: T9SS type A sorting domain-containing protein [Bacteroidia bacterium]
MKKSLQLFFGMAAFASVTMLAQPVLTATGINPVIGDIINQKTVGYVSPGNAGPNQTWNLSAMTGTAVVTSTVVSVGSTPNGSTFPNANVCLKGSSGSYTYIKTSSTVYQLDGITVPSGTTTIVFNYSNPDDLGHFPLNYTNSYTDAWAATFVSAGYTYYRTGLDSVTYDGYGTLILPSGTYSNVSRVHLVQNYQDSTNFGGIGPYVITYRNDEYFWYLNGNHTSIASVFTLTNSASGPTQSANYVTNITVGVEEENAMLNSCKLFPNPAASHVNLSVDLRESQKIDIKLYNTLGAQVNSIISAEGVVGTNNFKLDVSALPEGVYFAQIHLDGNLNTTRRFVVSK